jgi:hypothetical protein
MVLLIICIADAGMCIILRYVVAIPEIQFFYLYNFEDNASSKHIYYYLIYIANNNHFAS